MGSCAWSSRPPTGAGAGFGAFRQLPPTRDGATAQRAGRPLAVGERGDGPDGGKAPAGPSAAAGGVRHMRRGLTEVAAPSAGGNPWRGTARQSAGAASSPVARSAKKAPVSQGAFLSDSVRRDGDRGVASTSPKPHLG